MKTYKLLLLLGCALFVSCNDFLDRPPVDKFTDEEFWQTETQARLFLYSIYPTLFGGFGTAQNPSWLEDVAPIRQICGLISRKRLIRTAAWGLVV